jgi:hypothetical protein
MAWNTGTGKPDTKATLRRASTAKHLTLLHAMIKLFVDDVRVAPEGWTQVWNIRDAHDFIEDNHAEISHIDFDYYLNEDMPSHTGSLLIRDLVGMKREGIKVFHQPIENYTFHSSDSSMNDVMRGLVEDEFGVKIKIKPELRLTQLQRMRNSKGRR